MMDVLGNVLNVLAFAVAALGSISLVMHTPWEYVLIAEALTLVIGVIAGVVPARRTAQLDPVEALRTG